jgi:hypothetical protein
MTAHGLCIDRVDRDEAGYHVRFGCTCGDYTAEETAPTEADVLTLARNDVRVHEATVTGAAVVHIRF